MSAAPPVPAVIVSLAVAFPLKSKVTEFELSEQVGEPACTGCTEQASETGLSNAFNSMSVIVDVELCPRLTELGTPVAGIRGYAFRLGSSVFPHLKLQVVGQSDEELVFSVDTHDQVRVPANHPDAAGWAQIQTANRKLKEEIERAWEAAGLLTFNALLRRELEK